MKVKCTCCNGKGIVQDWKSPEDWDYSKPWEEYIKALIYFDIECPKCNGENEVVVEWEDIKNGEHVCNMEDFIDCCKTKCFIDYDGHGDYADGKRKTNINIKPSHVMNGDHLTEFTHVVWYNR